MSDKIIVPTLGESVTEATVSKWLKNQGDEVTADEPIVELETDKVNVEVPAPSNGILESISVKEGQTVNVGALLGMINGASKKISKEYTEAKDYSPPKKKSKPVKKENPKLFEEKPLQLKPIKEKKINKTKPANEEPLILENVHEEIKTHKIKKTDPSNKTISPAARKMLKEVKVDVNKIQGTGKHGVILKEDIINLMGSKPSPSERKIQHGPEERIKMTRLRLTISKRLKEAQENA